MEGKHRLARIASSQLGVFTLVQAESVGISRHQLSRAVAAGELRRPFRGVFVDEVVAAGWRQEAVAAVLACGPTAVLSHRGAVAVHGLEDRTVAPRPIEVSVPAPLCPRVPGVVVHRVLLPQEHTASIGPLRVTSVARTLADASGFRTEAQLGEMLDSAFVRRLVTRAELEQVLEVLESCRGRRLARVRALLAQRGVEIEKAESRPEIRVYRAIVAGGLPAPVLQHWVSSEGRRFRLDLAYPEIRLGIEYLGFDAHATRSALGRDTRRDRLLTLAGWEIMYFTNADSDAEIVRDVGSRVVER